MYVARARSEGSRSAELANGHAQWLCYCSKKRGRAGRPILPSFDLAKDLKRGAGGNNRSVRG